MSWTDSLKTALTDARSITTNTVGGAFDRRIFFLHIQKCGGTSAHQAMRRLYKTANPTQPHIAHLDPGAAYRACKKVGMGMWEYRELLAHYFLCNPQYRYVAGHYQVSAELLEAHADEFDFVTIFRDPVKKWFSHYFFNRYKDDPRGRIEADIDEYIESTRAHDVGCDYVQLLAGTTDEDPAIAREQKTVDLALANLERFSVVGLLEQLDQFVDDFETCFGTRLDILHRNRNPASKKKRRDEITPEIRRRVEEICEPNQVIYDEVQRRLASGK